MSTRRRALWTVPAWAVLAAAGVDVALRRRPGPVTAAWADPPGIGVPVDPRTEAEAHALVRAAEAEAAARAAEERRKAALTGALHSYLASRGARGAVAVANHKTGSRYGYLADDKHATASIVKVEILAATIMQAATRGRDLTGAERALAAPMIQLSDNTATDSLWVQIGRAQGLATTSRTLGLAATAGSNGWWGYSTTTANDQVRLIGAVTGPGSPLPASGVEYLVKLMTTVDRNQDWGISAAAHAGERVALKNGWMPYNRGYTVNSIGRITGPSSDITMVVLCERNGDKEMAPGVVVVEHVARLTRQHLAW